MRQLTKPGVYKGIIKFVRLLHLAVEVELDVTHGPEIGDLVALVPDYRGPTRMAVGKRAYVILEKRNDSFYTTTIEVLP